MTAPDKVYTAMFERGAEWAGLTAESQMESVTKYAQTIEKQMGETIKAELLEKYLLGEPAILLSTASKKLTMAHAIKDGCFVHVGIQSHITPVTQEEIDRLPELLRYTEK